MADVPQIPRPGTSRLFPSRKGVLTFVVPLLLLLPGDAVHAGGLTREMAERRPRIRVGSLPFPSPIYDRVPDRGTGEHHYLPDHRTEPPPGTPEVSRGTFYTKRGGFLDIGHIRKAIDWTAYIAWHTERALRAGQSTIDFRFTEPSLYRLTLTYPPFWKNLSAEEREKLIPELSIRIAQRVTYGSLTWHEILTWHGYTVTLVVPERPSAFSFDDVISHFVGIKVAGDAIRDSSRPYNQAVTAALDREITALGRVSAETEALALDSVKHNWWTFGRTWKRFLDVGYSGEEVRPWLVRGLPFDSDPQPASYSLPQLASVRGRDFSDLLTLEIAPRVLQKKGILKKLPDGADRVIPKVHFPLIMAGIESEAQRQFGPFTAAPYPPNPVAKNIAGARSQFLHSSRFIRRTPPAGWDASRQHR